jgi:hypothetical protein
VREKKETYSLLIQDVTITTGAGKKFEFRGVSKKRVQPLNDTVVIMDFFSALDIAMGVVVLGPDMVIEYGNSAVTSSQIEDNGMLKRKSEADDMGSLNEA